MSDIQKHIKNNYECPLSHKLMAEPVLANDGRIYELEFLEKLMASQSVSPVTAIKITQCHDASRSNILLYLEENPHLYDEGRVFLPRSWVIKLFKAIVGKNCDSNFKILLVRDPRLLEYRFYPETTTIPADDKKSVIKDLKFKELNEFGVYTTLQLACEFGSPEMVLICINLLNDRAKLQAAATESKPAKFNPVALNQLLVNSLNNEIELSDDLKDVLPALGADIEQPDLKGKTLLHQFAELGNFAAVKWLLKHKANHMAIDVVGNSAYHNAILANHKDVLSILKLITDKTDFPINFRNSNGDNCLHSAVIVKAPNLELIGTLTKEAMGFKLHKNPNKFGKTPLEIAANRDSKDGLGMVMKIFDTVAEEKILIARKVNAEFKECVKQEISAIEARIWRQEKEIHEEMRSLKHEIDAHEEVRTKQAAEAEVTKKTTTTLSMLDRYKLNPKKFVMEEYGGNVKKAAQALGENPVQVSITTQISF